MKNKINVVAGVIVNSDKKILLAKRKSGKWEFPGGKVELGETNQKALERELFEEFGVNTRTEDFIGYSTSENKNTIIDLFAYKSIVLEGDFKCKVHDEIIWEIPNNIKKYDLSEPDKEICEILIRVSS